MGTLFLDTQGLRELQSEDLVWWAEDYFDGALGLLVERLFNIYLNITDFCFRGVPVDMPIFITFFKYDWYHCFKTCLDLVCYDQPGKICRFTVIYCLLTYLFNNRLYLLTQLEELEGLMSNYMLYSSINWSEREVWDMYGILFYYHPDLRRILTDYGFNNFPLRKDFPLTGFVELVYSEYIKNPEYREVELTQDFRKTEYFNFWKKVTAEPEF